jgi:menaquinone-specific isochorismate synthase
VSTTTTSIDADLAPEAFGPHALFWHGPDLVLAGLGELGRIPVDRAGGPAGAIAAQRALVELVGTDTVDDPAVGPVAFAAMPFDPVAPGELVVPEVVVGRRSDGRRWLTVMGGGSVDDAVDRVRAAAPVPGDHAGPSVHEVRSVLAPEVWRDQIVAVVRDRIRAGELAKAVLARELVITADRPIDRAEVVRRLVATHPAAFVFAVGGFIGASPELLVSRTGDVVRAHPLAGTAPRRSDPAGDQQAAAGLLASTKDRWEHRITIEWLLDELLPFASYVDAEPDPTIVSLPNVHHLGTRVEGRLSAPAASILELVAALHPTPAVGGDPRDLALALIASTERADRGRYAGPVGWVDVAGNGAFAVGIRSAEVAGSTARLFAGVGVVADSDPEAELAETRAKFAAMLGAVVRP